MCNQLFSNGSEELGGGVGGVVVPHSLSQTELWEEKRV